MRRTYKRGIMTARGSLGGTEWIQSMAMNLRRELSPPLNRVARQWRIRAQIIFFQRKEGVGLGKGARACG